MFRPTYESSYVCAYSAETLIETETERIIIIAVIVSMLISNIGTCMCCIHGRMLCS